jgi:hypothetical protein
MRVALGKYLNIINLTLINSNEQYEFKYRFREAA